MNFLKTVCPIAGLVIASFPLQAAAIDNMNNTAGFFNFTVVQTVGGQNFDNPVGYTPPTATANGNGTVTLANSDTHSDTTENIIDWTMPGGVSNPYMDLTSNRVLSLHLTGVNATREYDANILYFGPGSVNPTFLNEATWLLNADGTNLNPSLDVSSLAPGGAAQYFVRFRLLPPDQTGDDLTLDSISTDNTPEPGTAFFALCGVCVLEALRRVRRNLLPKQGGSRC